ILDDFLVYINSSSFNKLYNVGLKLNSLIKSLTSFNAFSFFSLEILDFDALIKIFFGECAISINSNNCVLYPTLSNRLALTASVISADTLSLTIPYLDNIGKFSGFIWLLNSC